jgi:copper transport protein
MGSSPRQIHLWFTEDVSPRFRSVQLIDRQGHAVRGARLERSTKPSSDVVVDVPTLRRGIYALAWHVLSQDDGHATSGTMQFGVRAHVGTRGRGARTGSAPAAVDIALRWLRFSLLAGLIGGLAFVAGALPAARRSADVQLVGRVRGRVLAVAAWCGALAVLVQAAALARQVELISEATGIGDLRSLLLSTRWGALWLAETGLLILVTVAAIRFRRASRILPLVSGSMGAAAAVALVSVEALGSHAASLHRGAFPIAADALHLLGAAVWMGLLAGLVITCWPAAGYTRRDSAALLVAIRRRLAIVAAGAAFAVTLTGLYAAGAQVASVDGLLLSFYGRTLLVKSALVAMVGVFGAANFVLLRRLSRGGRTGVVRTTVAAEGALGVAVLLAAGVLTAGAPARGSAFAQPRPVVAATIARQTRDLVLTATIRPNRPGTNVVRVVVASSIRPAPAPIAAVGVDLAGSAPISLRRLTVEQGWVTTVQLVKSGEARMRVVVRRRGSFLSAPFRWRVEPADPARPVVISSRRLAPSLDRLALLIVVLVGVGCALFVTSRSLDVRGGQLGRLRAPRAEGSR